MNKFRARQLDASKPIPVYMQEDIPDLSEYNAINRTVPQMPTGMEKDEETEHHLQQAIYHQRVIPVPEVFDSSSIKETKDYTLHDKLYPPTYKTPRQMIHIPPFAAEHEIPEYDLDSEDEVWLADHAARGELPLANLQFEEMMDRLEKASGLKAVTLPEAKVLLKDDDDLIVAVYDYWLTKRLRVAHALIPQVKSEKGVASAANDPYVAFRKRTEKMQTRKNRKNDETSYEKMLKLRRDLTRAVTLLEMIKRREKAKREHLHLNIEVFEKRFDIQDFSGAVLAEVNAQRVLRPAFAPLFSNHQLSSLSSPIGSISPAGSWVKMGHGGNGLSLVEKDDGRPKRSYKKRRRPPGQGGSTSRGSQAHMVHSYAHSSDPYSLSSLYPQDTLPASSEDEAGSSAQSDAEEDVEPDGMFAFRRRKFVEYIAPRDIGTWPWEAPGTSTDGGSSSTGDPRFRFCLASVSQPTRRCLGFTRRRTGRGGRIWLDRIETPLDDLWPQLDRVNDDEVGDLSPTSDFLREVRTEWPHYYPQTSNLDREAEDTSPRIPRLEDDNLTLPPSAVQFTAEMTDGSSRGLISELEISIPAELEALLGSSDDPLEIDLEDWGGADADGWRDSPRLAPPSTNNAGGGGRHSAATLGSFATQPTSRFMTADTVSCLPLSISPFPPHSYEASIPLPPFMPPPVPPSSVPPSSVPPSSLTFNNTRPVCNANPDSETVINGSDKLAKGDVVHKFDHEVLATDKNNGNVAAQKLLLRCNSDGSDEGSGVPHMTNGPASVPGGVTALDGTSKCGKVDHYLFYEL